MEKKIKSAEEILDKWYQPLYAQDIQKICTIQAMKEYAAQMIEAQLEIAAEEARTEVKLSSIDFTPISNEPEVDRDSIKNCARIKLD